MIWFHVAPIDAHDSIARFGLDPDRSGQMWPGCDYPKGVYIFGDGQAADEYRRILEERDLDEYGIVEARKFEVWAVNLPEGFAVESDPFTGDESGLGVTSMFTGEPIPPHLIEARS